MSAIILKPMPARTCFCIGATIGIWLWTWPLSAERVQVTVLATTDLHGNLYPVDYYEPQRPAHRGLAKIATLIREQRASNPHNLLVDCGDTIQGTPLEYVYQTWVRSGHLPLRLSFAGEPPRADPMMLAMNELGYDAMALGNHEFNFGLKNLNKARAEARFPWLAANATGFPRYLLKTVGGVKVAIIGVTTPVIPAWEKPENLGDHRFQPAREAVEQTLAELKPHRPDLILVAAHSGLGHDPKTGARRAEDMPGENIVHDLASTVTGIDAIVFGHTHREFPGLLVNGVLLVQPKNWGMSLARIDFTLDGKPGSWKIAGKTSRLIPVTAQTAADEKILSLARPYHEIAERYLSTVVARAPAPLEASLGRVDDTALVDAVQQVQMHYAQADVSFTSLFNPRSSIPQGPVTVRRIAALYLYENELYAIEGDGRMVKEALENAARYFTNPRILGYNYDMAAGVEYEIDVTRPEGDRIRDLRWKGRPLSPEQKLRIAVNNYRAGGSGGYTMFRGAKIVWRSPTDIRQLIIDYYSERGELPARADGNWRIVPETSRRGAEVKAREHAARPGIY